MIDKFVMSRRKPIYVPPSKPKHIAITGVVPGMMAEANRRDAICRKLGEEVNFSVGDIVLPWNQKEQDDMGVCRCTYIADTYVKFGKHNEWPKNDHPHIITIWSEKLHKSFLCTTTYAKKAPA